jgi:hypothetical protein
MSHFPWWQHWPVAQIPSDGRYCQAPDRASHFALGWCSPPPHRGEEHTYWWAWLYGATNESIEAPLPVAKSWINPPELRVYSSGYENHGYDPTQRCYLIEKTTRKPEALEVELKADEGSPVFNPAVYIENWGNSHFSLRINGKELINKKACRIGYVDRLGTTDLVIWLGIEENAPTTISLIPER